MKSEKFATARLAFSYTLSMCFIDDAKVQHWGRGVVDLWEHMWIYVQNDEQFLLITIFIGYTNGFYNKFNF